MFDARNKKVYIIAEMSANHAGELSRAIEIVQKAASAGADCIKIQTYTANTLTIDCDNEYFQIKGGLWDGRKLYDLYADAYTPWEWTKPIMDECRRCGVDFLSTPFDNTAVDYLESMGCEAYKIASFEMVDIPLIEYVASKGKPLFISCGMGSPEEIQDAVNACIKTGNDKVVLLKCCSEYPANPADMHLANIQDMKQRFGFPVGLSDHSMGFLAAVVGVSLGAQVIEKHICISRTIQNPDSEFSMEIEEFEQMVKAIRDVSSIIGKAPDYSLTEGEKKSTVFRRSLFAVKDIKAGEAFSADNIRSIRPGNGIMPKHYKRLLKEKAACDILSGTPLSEDMILFKS